MYSLIGDGLTRQLCIRARCTKKGRAPATEKNEQENREIQQFLQSKWLEIKVVRR